MHKVCVVIPVYKNFFRLADTEIISWRQCLAVLNAHEICLACPVSLDVSDYVIELQKQSISYHVTQFPASSFADIEGYNQLMLSKSFYQRFIDYNYILTYQLDAYIFKDDLAKWCELDYSYVGAPWFEGFNPGPADARLWKVGNGGFTLRKVSSCLRVLTTFSSIWTQSEVIKWYFRYGRKQGLKSVPKILKRLFVGNNTHWFFNDFYLLRERFQEDYFWGVVCSEKFDWYKVPSPQEALKFSFEVAPRRMYELNSYQLPVGCHAWEKYEPDFWQPFMPGVKS
ncbi:MAG: hypothetical protein EOP45_08110 [Sphingobacteriaceae bacterium]|nr:MAG: hypothetical protein EOP45_08110 [Sphingobacteriaceae bacterium]